MTFEYKGQVAWIFPDHYDVDQIVGIQNIRETDLDKLMPLCMADYETDFLSKVKEGDILVAGKNFGYGHPHFQAMALMRKIGIWAVLAESFAPTFYRSEVANAMALLVVPDITSKVKRFDSLKVIFDEGTVYNEKSDTSINGVAPPEMVLGYIKHNGIIGFIKDQLKTG